MSGRSYIASVILPSAPGRLYRLLRRRTFTTREDAEQFVASHTPEGCVAWVEEVSR